MTQPICMTATQFLLKLAPFYTVYNNCQYERSFLYIYMCIYHIQITVVHNISVNMTDLNIFSYIYNIQLKLDGVSIKLIKSLSVHTNQYTCTTRMSLTVVFFCV